jgi:hypothetical protein
MEKRQLLKNDSHFAGQGIPRLRRSHNIHHRIYKSPPLDPCPEPLQSGSRTNMLFN